MPIVISSIEGNIGSGKSTLINYLHDLQNCTIMHEPVDIWRNITGDTEEKTNTNILDTYYTNPKRWSYTFQSFAFITRYMELQKVLQQLKNSMQNEQELSIIISERSHFTDKEIFARTLYENGNICDLEMKLYLYWFNSLSAIHNYNKIIYVRTNSEIAYQRIRKRGRPEENDITLTFLEQIHDAHEQWLLNEHNRQVLILDGNIDMNEDQEVLKRHKQAILDFIREPAP